MTATFDLNDLLFILGSFTCVSVPLVLLVFARANYRIVPRDKDEAQTKEEKYYGGR